MDDSSMQSLTADVEKELLDSIIKNLDEKRMTEDEARELAREFISLLPMQDKKDLLDKLYKLSKEHVEAKGVYLKYAKPYEEEDRLKKIALMSEHIKNGQIEHAITVAKGDTPNA
jgi:hypothetical protein